MKKISCSFLIFFIFVAQGNAADICEQQACPKGRIPIKICFNSTATNSGSYKKDATRVCYFSDKKILVSSNNDIRIAFDQAVKNCESLDEVIFNGHGDDGIQLTGDLNTVTIQGFKKYSCLFNKNASVEFLGCNVGKDCSGDLLMYQTAKTLLLKGGQVQANTDESISLIVGLTPPISSNLTGRKLIFEPEQSFADRWKFTGLGHFKTEKDMNVRCVEKIEGIVEKYEHFRKDFEKGNCAKSYTYMNSSKMAEINKIKNQLRAAPRFLQSSKPEVFKDVFEGLLSMKTDIVNYSKCWPQRADSSFNNLRSRSAK